MYCTFAQNILVIFLAKIDIIIDFLRNCLYLLLKIVYLQEEKQRFETLRGNGSFLFIPTPLFSFLDKIE